MLKGLICTPIPLLSTTARRRVYPEVEAASETRRITGCKVEVVKHHVVSDKPTPLLRPTH